MVDVEVVADTVVDNSTPVESAVIEAPPAEKTTQENLDEVVAKVKERDKEGTKGSEGTEEEKAAAAALAASYKPNFKFKANKQEHEFPKTIQDLIKNEATEKEIRALYEKSFGIDEIKTQREALQAKTQELTNQVQFYSKPIEELKSLYQKGMIDQWLARMQVPQERILQWAIEKAAYLQADPATKARVDNEARAQAEAFYATRTNASMNTDYTQKLIEAKKVALDATLARPDYSAMASEFDQKAAKPGAFRELVVNTGEMAWFKSQGKLDLTPDQAIQEAMKLYGIKPPVSGAATQTVVAQPGQTVDGTAATTAGPAGIVVAKPAPKGGKTIPNISGSGGSPLPKKPKSIADLQKTYQDKYG